MANPIDSASTSTALDPKYFVMNLKYQLKLYLELRELTATQLARKAQVSKQLISLWLSGSPPKNVAHIKRVADVLGTTVDNLVYGDGEENFATRPTQSASLDSLLGNEWLSGRFEIKLRRIK